MIIDYVLRSQAHSLVFSRTTYWSHNNAIFTGLWYSQAVCSILFTCLHGKSGFSNRLRDLQTPHHFTNEGDSCLYLWECRLHYITVYTSPILQYTWYVKHCPPPRPTWAEMTPCIPPRFLLLRSPLWQNNRVRMIKYAVSMKYCWLLKRILFICFRSDAVCAMWEGGWEEFYA